MNDGPIHTQGRRVAHLSYEEHELGMENARPYRELVVDVPVDDGRSYGETAEVLDFARRLFDRSSGDDRIQELLDRLGLYRETFEAIRTLVETMVPENENDAAQIAAITTRIDQLFETDGFAPDVRVLSVRVFLPLARYERIGAEVREYLQGAVRGAVELVGDPNGDEVVLPVGLVNFEDYGTTAPAVVDEPNPETSLREWFENITGWGCSPGAWSPEDLELSRAFQTFVDEWVETASGAPDRALQSVDDLYREAMSVPGLKIPTQFAEAVQSFRHGGRRPV